MELEQRVKLLEQEVKLLKNQIHTTLLDIQEQLLSAQFPALRAEAALSESPSFRPAADARPATPPPASASPLVKKVSLANLDDDDDEAVEPAMLLAEPMPQPVAAARLQDSPVAPAVARPPAAGAAPETATLPPEAQPDSASDSGTALDWESLAWLTRWTIHTAARLGPAQTGELIQGYVDDGLFDDEAASLLKLIATRVDTNGLRPLKAPGAPLAGMPPALRLKAAEKLTLRAGLMRAAQFLRTGGAPTEA